MKRPLRSALALALATAVASSGGASAMNANTWRDLLEVLPDLKTMFDAAPGLIANDLPSLVSSDGELQERLDRAKNFHFTHEFKEAAPKIEGDRLFSKDLKVGAAMRDEYAGFVDSEARDIERLKVGRDAKANQLADYQRLLDRNADFSNKAPDLIGRAGMVSDEMALELATVLLTVQQAIPLAQGLVDEYQRIFRDYDSKIRQEEVAHEGHVKTLGIVDAIRPKPQPAGHGAGAAQPPASTKPRVGSGTAGAMVGDRLRSAINGATAEVDAHASRSQTQLSLEQRQMGPIRPMPSQQGTSAATQKTQADFYGTITTYPNSR